jgi:hypothetical protein
MSGPYDRPHLDIERLISRADYKSRSRGGGGRTPPEVPATHGARLADELAAAFAASEEARPVDAAPSVYLEIEGRPNTPLASLERRSEDVRQGATKTDQNNVQTTVIQVPDEARQSIFSRLDQYRTATTAKGKPRYEAAFGPIGHIRQALLDALWTDPRGSPPPMGQAVWWELWCWADRAEVVKEAARRLGSHVSDLTLKFPELITVPVHAERTTIETLVAATGGISEIRRASDTAAFFTTEVRETQQPWVDDLAARIVWPGEEVPAVCLLDTGVNRAHPLIEPALSPDDTLAVNELWSGTDEPEGHGTGMAGIALHGDLTPRLADQSRVLLNHRLESVKLLPPQGFPPNNPTSYGPITASAVALIESKRPFRPRVVCTAITNQDLEGSRPTSWSAAVDQIAAGVGTADEGEETIRRLIVLTTGNIPTGSSLAQVRAPQDFVMEDPAQSWNPLCVGGYTEKTLLVGTPELHPVAAVGEVSPYSRCSAALRQSLTPFKPDIVFETGNRAYDSQGVVYDGVDSLSLLTTGNDFDHRPLDTFFANSAATAQAARMAAILMAEYPSYWPETLRGLMVHSAEWTPEMRRLLDAEASFEARYRLLRTFGHGVPRLDRALRSARDDLALVSQAHIQPFLKDADGIRFSDIHYYALPWPRDVLEQLGDVQVQLKVTLSYFIEPSPGGDAPVNVTRYRSHGLRFDLKRRDEPRGVFRAGVNANENAAGKRPNDEGWTFGPNSISAGSLHSDTWNGTALQLASRNELAVFPVGGWWRERLHLGQINRRARYALIVTLSAAALPIGIDLQASIKTMIESMVAATVEIAS